MQQCGLGGRYTETHIREVTGRLLTNTTSLQLEGAGVGVGLYPGYAMGNHACRWWDRRSSELLMYSLTFLCRPNVRTVVEPDHRLVLVALTNIQPGAGYTKV